MSRIVPLVIYDEEGNRIVIGTAEVTPEERGLGISTVVENTELSKRIISSLGGYSIAVKNEFCYACHNSQCKKRKNPDPNCICCQEGHSNGSGS